METININNINQYVRSQTTYFHDSHIIEFTFFNNYLKITLEKYDRTNVSLTFNVITKIEYRTGDTNEIDIKNRILDIDIQPHNNILLVNLLMFNMSFIDIYCESIEIS